MKSTAARNLRLIFILIALFGLIAAAPVERETAPATAPTDEVVDSPPHDAAVVPATSPATANSVSSGAGDHIFSSSLPTGANVALIRIDGMIYDFTLESLKSRVDRAIKSGASLIVFEIDTNGGLVTSATDISKYIKAIPVPTLAWVNPKAYSAGIMIASSCNGIVMAPSAAMGDCAPIQLGASLAPTERAKALSPVLAEFRDNAQHGGYDYTLFHAMCELGVEVYEIQNPATGEHRLVNQADYEIMVKGASPDSVRAAGRTAGWTPPAPPLVVTPATNPASGPPSTSTITAAVPPPGTQLGGGGFMPEEASTEADRGAWRFVRQIHDGKSLLTVHQNQGMDIGLSRGIVRNEADVKTFLGAASVTRVDLPLVEGVAYWLTRPWARAILMVILLVGGYFELQAPGLAIGGTLAAVALVLLLVAPFLVGLAEVWQLLLFLLGLVMLLVEIFVIPGFGFVGIIGVILMFVGLVLAIVPTTSSGPLSLPAPGSMRQLQESLLWTVIGLVFSAIGFFYTTRYFGHLPVVNRLVLSNGPAPLMAPRSVAGAAGQVSGDEAIGHGRIVAGATGRASSHLRPSGRAEIGGQMVDVVTVGSWLEPGTPVRVVEVAGNRIVVDRDV